MSLLRAWVRAAATRAIVLRALATSVVVGTVLVLVNRPTEPLPVALTFAVPYIVATVTAVAGVADRNGRGADVEIESLSRVPGRNPNPVMRMRRDGTLLWANESSEPLRTAFGVEVGGRLAPDLVERLLAAAEAADADGRTIEVESGIWTYRVLAVPVPELGVVNLYGTDITGAKVVERFPERNPNPVMRMTREGTLLYANTASAAIVRALGVRVGDLLPAQVRDLALRALEPGDSTRIELQGEGRTFALWPVWIPEFEFVNLYGTDITALKALDKFPDRNPNPVMRASRDGVLTYANPASALVRKAIGTEVGQQLPDEFFGLVRAALETKAPDVIECSVDGRVFELLVVSLYEFESINLYGTEVTAARAVDKANRENERLLLNILPPSIADRLRGGETVIADRFDEMTVLFADCVGFTELSSYLSPAEVVVVLNEVFSMFDTLADRYGLEKIKTIGDAYMVVGGLEPDPEGRSHVARVAEMALDMIDAVAAYRERTGSSLEVRIGMHAGPTVAGVIGLKKFIYDVWGDAVNTASRMESTGVPGRIQVSEQTQERLGSEFAFEPRGEIEIKGKGRLRTWFLVGRS
jgi:class 3 adenylate cyclase